MQILAARIAQGVPYCWGSRDPDVHVASQEYGTQDPILCPTGYGLDCSGAVIWAYREAGLTVPNASAQGLYDALPHVSCDLADLSATGDETCWATGDLIFLGRNADAGQIYHVAAYAGGGLWNDCYSTSTGCRTWRIEGNAAYQNDFAGAARPSLAWGGGECGDGGAPGPGPGPGGGPGTEPAYPGKTPGEIGGRFALMYTKEPIGTILQLGNYLGQISDSVKNTTPQTAVASGGPSSLGPFGALLPGVSVGSAATATIGSIDLVADQLDSYTIGGVSGLEVIRLFFDLGAIMLLVFAVRRSIIIAA